MLGLILTILKLLGVIVSGAAAIVGTAPDKAPKETENPPAEIETWSFPQTVAEQKMDAAMGRDWL
jgi:hypothetical protein